jgi:hypothetical protein
MSRITIVSRWEHTQMDPEIEWNMWRQLRGAFGIDRFIMVPHMVDGLSIEQYDTMKEALAHTTGQRCFLEPRAENMMASLASAERQGITFVLGNTQMSNEKHILDGIDWAVRIPTPGMTDLYGINAAAVALSIWQGIC